MHEHKTPKKRKIGLKSVLLLQVVFLVLSLTTVCQKLASGAFDSLASVFTLRFIVPFAIELFILGAYAIVWQQIIKHFELSVVYANRATVLLWTLLWGAALFSEAITPA
ncbi:MAG: hypothetical protein LBI54_02050, partial [Lachnospiraceae bacterium]|nr:hypothetical protein [Lachnospiraceae bacterium]